MTTKEINTEDLPKSTDKLHEYLSNLNVSIDNLLITYEKSFPFLSNDMYSMLIFLDYTELYIQHKMEEEYEVIDKLFCIYRGQFKAYHAFWKRYLDFSIFNMRKEFGFVYEKLIKYINQSQFEGKDDLLEYFIENKSIFEEKVKNNQRFYISNAKLFDQKFTNVSYNNISTPVKKFKSESTRSYQSKNKYLEEKLNVESSAEVTDSNDFYNIFSVKEVEDLKIESEKKEKPESESINDESNKTKEESINDESIKTKDESIIKSNKIKEEEIINIKINHQTKTSNEKENSKNIYDQLTNIKIHEEISNNKTSNISSTPQNNIINFDNVQTQEEECIPIIQNTQPLHNNDNRYFMFKQMHCMFISNIGKGGFSRVQQVLIDKQIYALKRVFKGDYTAEIKILNKLKGIPNNYVIEMIDYNFNRQEDSLDILFEYGEIDLQKRLNIYAYDKHFIKYVCSEILSILVFLHANDIVHKDLKPCNFVFVKNKLKVIDFGISTEIGPDTSSCLNSKEGTFCYSAPEVFHKQKVGKSADIWSFGAILYYMTYKQTVCTVKDIQKMYKNNLQFKDIEYPQRDFNNNVVDEKALDLMQICLVKNPKERKKAEELLLYHPYFV